MGVPRQPNRVDERAMDKGPRTAVPATARPRRPDSGGTGTRLVRTAMREDVASGTMPPGPDGKGAADAELRGAAGLAGPPPRPMSTNWSPRRTRS